MADFSPTGQAQAPEPSFQAAALAVLPLVLMIALGPIRSRLACGWSGLSSLCALSGAVGCPLRTPHPDP